MYKNKCCAQNKISKFSYIYFKTKINFSGILTFLKQFKINKYSNAHLAPSTLSSFLTHFLTTQHKKKYREQL